MRCTLDLLNVWSLSLWVIHHTQSPKTCWHVCTKISGSLLCAWDWKRGFTNAFGPGGARTNRLPAAFPHREKEMETDREECSGFGERETRGWNRIPADLSPLSCAAPRILSAEVNFNSAAVATNKNPLIKQRCAHLRVRRWMSARAPLPLDSMLSDGIETDSCELLTWSSTSARRERGNKKENKRTKEIIWGEVADNQTLWCCSEIFGKTKLMTVAHHPLQTNINLPKQSLSPVESVNWVSVYGWDIS